MQKVAVLVGSLRRESINLKLAKALEKLASGRLAFSFADIGSLPYYDDNLWSNPPESVTRFKHEIDSADGVLLVTPEFNRSIPAVLKNAIDWGSRPWGQSSWAGKPGAVIGTTTGATGTTQAQAHLRSIMVILDVILMGRPEIYFQSRPGLIDDNFDVTDADTKAFLAGWTETFARWIERHCRYEAPAAAAE